MSCYVHHPDFHGRKPTHEMIARLHREHLERQAEIHARLNDLHQRVAVGDGLHPDRGRVDTVPATARPTASDPASAGPGPHVKRG
jgi:hypothetical protein